MSKVFDRPLVFVDLETTGGSHLTSRVLEVAAVRVERGQVVRSFQTLLSPDEPIPPFITSLTGITDGDVVGKPRFGDIASDLADILEGAVFVAHNVRFDYGFLKMEYGRLGVPFNPPLLCTVRLSRRLFPQYRTHKLADLIARHGLEAPSRHRAFDDAMCLWQFYRLCLAEFDLDTVEAAIGAQLALPSLPSQLDQAQVDALPDGPGVYVFEDAEGSVLYVGKSVHVRRRVLNHFSADVEDGKELKLARLVRKVRAVPTPGELSALILESDMVKDLQPLYNRLLRRRERVVLVAADTTPDGYATVRLHDACEDEVPQFGDVLAVMQTAGRAKALLLELAAACRLCPKLLGLERGRGACFGRQLGKCDGACTGQEAPADYNARFGQAFVEHRLAVWPYSGAVLIREEAADGRSWGFVVDRWCLIARLVARPDEPVQVTRELAQFDLDRYKIVRQYLRNPAMRPFVTPLSTDQMAELLQ